MQSRVQFQVSYRGFCGAFLRFEKSKIPCVKCFFEGSRCEQRVDEMQWWNVTGGGTEVLGQKPVRVPLCPTKIPHGLSWDRALVSARKLATDRLNHGEFNLLYVYRSSPYRAVNIAVLADCSNIQHVIQLTSHTHTHTHTHTAYVSTHPPTVASHPVHTFACPNDVTPEPLLSSTERHFWF